MPYDFRDLDAIIDRLFEKLASRNVALYVTRDVADDACRPVLKVQARLAGECSEAELSRVLSAGRHIVRQIGTDARFWTAIHEPNVVEFCFAAIQPAGSRGDARVA